MVQVSLKGNPVEISGDLPQVGLAAPDFKLVGPDLAEFSLASFAGKTKVILAVPSLDTPVCATQTRVFNQKAGSMDQVAVIVVSGDLPFAMKRFCTVENIENVSALSQYRDMNFSKAYGIHITNGPLRELSARAIIIVNKDNTIVYTELVPDISQEPDYDHAMEAILKETKAL